MKARITYLVICLLVTASLKAQIKIGDNPQNLDSASVLELESNSRVLVITRMTTIQMENTSPLRGAVVYNTDTQCVHFYDGALWINLCDRPDEQTFSTDAIVNFSPTMIITPDANGTNFNFEVGEIRGENIVDTSINGSVDIQEGSITGLQLQDATVSFDKLADGTATGELLQWNGAEWVLIDETGLTVTEIDGVVGNEVRDAADGTLVRTGLGTDANPFVLDVSVGGITNLELGADAVTTDKILNGEVDADDIANDAITNLKMANDAIDTDEIVDDAITADKIDVSVAGTGLTQNLATGALDVDVASLTGDGDIISADLTVTGGTDAAFTNVNLEITAGAVGNTELAADAVTTDKIAIGAVESTDIAVDAVNAAAINVDVAGNGLTQNLATGALDVDVASLTGDGDITSADLTVTGGTDAAFTNVNLEITAGAVGNTELAADAVTTDKIAIGAVESTDIAVDAVNAAAINVDVAGNGLTQNLATGALDVDVASLTGDGDITSADLTVTGGTDAAFTNVNLEITAGAVGNTELAADAVTTDKIAIGAVESTDIAVDAVNAAAINVDVAGNGLTQNLATGALDVDVASLTGDGDITSADLTVTGGTDAAFTNVNLEITAGAVGNTELAADAVTTDKIAIGAVESTDIAVDAVNAAAINVDVAGNGLTQNLATGALDVDVASLTGDGDITSADLTVTGGTDAAFTNVNLEITAGAVGNTELAADAVTTDKIADGTITNDDINAAAAILGTKINPDFGAQDVLTNGDFIDTGVVIVPDFVFEKYYGGFSNLNVDYKFRSLETVEAFIKEHNHLPGIRSAYEIKKSREYRLTESSLNHLEKIEELFLHTIEQEKKIEELKSDNEKLIEEVNSLKADIKLIKNMLSEKDENK